MRKAIRSEIIVILLLVLAPSAAGQRWKYLTTADSDSGEVKVYYKPLRRYGNRIARFQVKLIASDRVSILVAEFDCRTEDYRTIQKIVFLRRGEKRVYSQPGPWEAITSFADFRTPLFREPHTPCLS